MFLHKDNTMAILLKTAPVWVSSIQIMQIRVQTKGKRVWEDRYDGDVSVVHRLIELTILSLSASIIADVIRKALKGDLELSKKNVRALVKQHYINVRPSYNKLWCGREKAIALLFGN